MWPFDKSKERHLFPQVPAGSMHQPVDMTPEARIRALEVKCAQLEWAIHEICTAIQITQEASNHNFASMERMFQKLVQYVMRPSKHIMGEQKDVN